MFLLGIVLIGFSGILCLLSGDMHRKDMRKIQFEIENAKVYYSDRSRKFQTTRPVDQLNRYYNSFPFESDVPDLLSILYSVANAHALNIDKANYTLVAGVNEKRLGVYKIAIVIKGNYSELKGFIFQTLAELPTLSLNEITMNRREVGEKEVNAELEFSIFFR